MEQRMRFVKLERLLIAEYLLNLAVEFWVRLFDVFNRIGEQHLEAFNFSRPIVVKRFQPDFLRYFFYYDQSEQQVVYVANSSECFFGVDVVRCDEIAHCGVEFDLKVYRYFAAESEVVQKLENVRCMLYFKLLYESILMMFYNELPILLGPRHLHQRQLRLAFSSQKYSCF